MSTMPSSSHRVVIAFVGMPGAGKTEAVIHLQRKGVPFVRFGDLTDEGLKKENLAINPANEQAYRERIRKEFGMAAYAIKAEPKIREILQKGNIVAIDGLYSWEEYKYLKERFPELKVIFIYAEPRVRYERLSTRPIRPLTPVEAKNRDIAEIEKLHKGGSIAIADYLIVNNSSDMGDLHKKLEELFVKLNIHL
jgi:dephospho-CoA kinase